MANLTDSCELEVGGSVAEFLQWTVTREMSALE